MTRRWSGSPSSSRELPASSADGWRGWIGTSFTRDTARLLVRAILDVVRQDNAAPNIVVGYDSRHLSEVVAQDTAECVRQVIGTSPCLVRFLPTSTASYLTTSAFDLAILITASHNSARWNGIKLKIGGGQPAPPDLIAAVDEWLRDTVRMSSLSERELLSPSPPQASTEAAPFIDQHVASLVARARGPHRPFRVVVDGLGGIAETGMVRLGAALGWMVTPFADGPTAEFHGSAPDPSIPENRIRSGARVREHGADFGIVLDGDGDRIYFQDETGTTVQPPDLLALLLEHQTKLGNGIATVGLTQSTGMSIRLAAGRRGISVLETPIGFKHLAPLIASGDIDMAGGAVGDVALRGWSVDRDPLATATLVSELLSQTGRTLSDEVGTLRRDLGTDHLRWFEALVEPDRALTAVDRARALRQLGDGLGVSAGQPTPLAQGALRLAGTDHQWLMVRSSTTESGLRFYGEVAIDDPVLPTFFAEQAALALRSIPNK